MIAKVVKRRNRQLTMERILSAMGEMMAERGTRKAGINAVAERAGINKVLIYRYFGGWDGLLEAYVQRGHFLSVFNEKYIEEVPMNLSGDDRTQVWADYVVTFMNEFRDRKSAQELVRWEMTNGETDVAQRLADFRDESFRKMIVKLAPYPDDDPSAITALMIAGVTYLGLIAEQREQVLDINLHSEEGWHRIGKAIKRIFYGLNTPGMVAPGVMTPDYRNQAVS
jgi:AcrR family transcriptional regulator